MSVAVFRTEDVIGEAIAIESSNGCVLRATFEKLPPGKHGFHIHEAGDLRAAGCAGACAHWNIGTPKTHGDRPGRETKERHTGDLGNVEVGSYKYILEGVKPEDLWGRTLVVHEDEDDLGHGSFEDSPITGHSGSRIACAIFGRSTCDVPKKKEAKDKKTRKSRR